ncbi:tetratricopeptide repeat protein [Brachyspira intermedia]|uniref:tetratricopeptide repeat protein n=1 Tax=Brachyspira intermedia TaxID=84377 RepID=UPI0030052899
MISDIKEKAHIESNQLINSIKKQAEEETKKLIEENNRNIKISNLFNSAYQSYNNKEYDKAINYYNQIIEIIDDLLKGYDENSEEYSKYKNNYLIAYNNRANAKSDLGLYEEAIKDFDKAIELNPNNFMAYYNKGLAKSDLGHNEEAYNNFIKGYDLADDTSKKEYKQRIIDLARDGNETAIKICDEKGWKY